MDALLATLPTQAVVSGVLLLGFLMYHLAWVLGTLLITSLYVSPKEQSRLAQYARRGLVGKFVGFLVLLVSTCLRLMALLLQACVLILYSFLPLVMLALLLSRFEQQWGDTAAFLTSTLNDPRTPIAQSITILIRIPLHVLDLVATYVLPLYNLLIYIFVNLPLEMLVEFFLGGGAQEIGAAVNSFAQSVPLLVSSAGAYVRANQVTCAVPQPTCWNMTDGLAVCEPLNAAALASLCLDASSREMQLLPAMDKLREACTYLLRGVALGCGSLQAFINVCLFPLTDASLWQALSSWLNALLYLVFGAPTTTAARCSLAGGFSARPAMCTPDFGPSFDLAAAGMQQLGTAIDNFVDMLYMLILFGNGAQCPSSNTNAMNLDWTLDPVALTLFGSNTTLLLSLSTTDTLWALTDGQNAVFIKYTSAVTRSYYPNLWGPSPVDPRYGIAALQDGSMLGCSCTDSEALGLVVQCTVAKTSSTVAFNASWEIGTAPLFMKCASVRILVQSIRWPETRVLYTEQLASVPPSTAQLAADAAVYVIPSCGGKTSNLLACINPAVFTLSNCFPFCMALHMTSSSAPSLILRGYDSWANGVFVTSRDCVPVQAVAPQGDITTSCSSSVANAGTATTGGGALQCTYSAICSTWIANKSAYAVGGAHYQASIPAFADTSQYVSLVLQGQPLVAAGGVVMRLSKDAQTQQSYIDFPMVTGNQYNEFNMEVASPVGIPVVPLTAAAVPADLAASEKAGYITVPPTDIEMVDLYNPATLSTDALWYAVNPSYDWLYGMAQYCATQGAQATLQFSFVSSYSAIRVWRVYYKNSACFINAFNLEHICRSDVATGFDLDPQWDIPPSLVGNLVQDCLTFKEFNLLVESMQYYDENNMVLSVRRGTLQALYNLMSGKREGDLGRIVFYFVNAQNVSQIRANEPWGQGSFPSVVSGSGVLCPALRFLPSLGTFVAQSAIAVLYSIKVGVNLLANPFALQELLVSRAQGVCPGAPLNHQALMDCGMGLLSLDDMFSALYNANTAFWNILAWLASQLRPQASASPLQGIFEDFLAGFAAYGEAEHIVSLFEVSDMVNLFDTGMQDYIVGGGEQRRRLLQANTTRGQPRRLLGFKNVGRRIGKSLLSGLLHALSGSVQKIFSMSKSLVSAMTLSASSADFSVLVATDNPTYMLGSAVTAPGIAWAHYTYDTLVPMALDLAAVALYQGPTSNLLLNSTAIVWVNLQESQDNFNALIDARLYQGCAALRLMLGYNSGLATAVYYNCMSAVDMHAAFFQLLLILTTDMPLFSCM